VKKLSNDLIDRVLRFDGVSVVAPEMVARLLLLNVQPVQIRVTGDAWEIEQFNLNVPDSEVIKHADTPEPIKIDLRWQLPAEYQDLDLTERVVDALTARSGELNYTSLDETRAAARIAKELIEINRRGMQEFMRTVVYVLDTFRKNGVVWGVGRGSSCASYILFLLGLHAVDCLRLDVPLEEFFHD
jgi:DNA polymerase III alpha subunit